MSLIDRGKVMNDYLENLGRADSYKAKYEALVKAIDNAYAVDAEPVRHATWSKNISGEYVFCSACNDSSFGGGCFAFPNRPEITIWRYCPNCGAKMNKEE